jgi:nucleoside-diphosphate-sugar epimerase
VAGGAGYVGSVLTPLLLERGHEVSIADACWFGRHLPAGVPVIETELFALDEKRLGGYDALVFIAGLSNDPMAEFDPALNFKQNAALPAYLAYCARLAGVRRFVYGSSCSIYGHTGNQLCFEDSPTSCTYPYGVSKHQGELGAMLLAGPEYSVIALRQGTVNGHSPRMRFDLIVNTMCKSARTTGRITVNNPAIWRPLIDVRDTSEAFLRAVEADISVSGVFNVAKDNYTVGQVAERVAEALQRLTGRSTEIEVLHRHDLRNYKVDCAQARAVLGFSPQRDIEEMVLSLHEHWDEYGDPEEERYHNIRVFKRLHPGLSAPVSLLPGK